jgi:hypothetical protein
VRRPARHVRRALRARQASGFAAFNWPDATDAGSADGEDSDAIGAAGYRDGCPASCYTSTSAGSYPSMTAMPTLTSPGGSYNTNTSTTQNCGYGNSLYCDEDTTTTSTATGTTLVTLTRPYPASTPTGYGDTSYTGDTLANSAPRLATPSTPASTSATSLRAVPPLEVVTASTTVLAGLATEPTPGSRRTSASSFPCLACRMCTLRLL